MTRSQISAACLILVGSVASCTDGDWVHDPAAPEHCRDRGRIHPGPIVSSHWKRADSPHILKGPVVVGDLRIEPGVVVCAAPGASVTAETVTAHGTADLPIVFDAAGPEFWHGIIVRQQADLRHVILRSAEKPISEEEFGTADIIAEDSRFEKVVEPLAARAITLRRVVIDSACYGRVACSAVLVQSYTSADLEDVSILDSGGFGVATADRCSLRMKNVRIEGSRETGLTHTYSIRGSCTLTVEGDFRVTRGLSYPLVGSSELLKWLRPEYVHQVTGNAADTIVIEGPGGLHDMRITAVMSLRVANCSMEPFENWLNVGQVVIEAGGTLTVQGTCRAYMDLLMEGTADDPATLRGSGLRIRISSSAGPDMARVRHALLSGVSIRAISPGMVFENVQMNDAALELLAPFSLIDGLHATGTVESLPYGQDTVVATVTLATGTTMRNATLANARIDAVRVVGDATVERCTLTGSGQDAVRVESGALRIQQCNLVGNTGAGMNNVGGTTAIATDNWWGDAAGPLGPGGDGVQGSVSYTPWRTEPVLWRLPSPTP